MAEVRKAAAADFAQILQIYASARTFMAENGNGTQWVDHFPPAALIEEDIRKEQLYVVEASGCIHGVFAFLVGEDPAYAVIENGAWLSSAEYGTIHRLASDGKIHGVLESALAFCCGKIPHLRIDTHENNTAMRHLLEKNRFCRCGVIRIADGTARIAYERTEAPGGRSAQTDSPA